MPLGTAQADATVAADALGPYEAPEPVDADVTRLIREFLGRTGLEPSTSGHGWRVVLPLRLDRKQAVYIGYAGSDPEGQPIVSLVSVCGPANERDLRILLKLNAQMNAGHFAIRTLLGEEYFVVIHNVPASLLDDVDAAGLVRRIAIWADGFEDRLSRGRDLY